MSYFKSQNSGADQYLSATALDVLTKMNAIDKNFEQSQNMKSNNNDLN